MSDIFLNYDDVRHLVKFLGKYQPDEDTSFARIRLIAAGLQTNVGLLNSRLQSNDTAGGTGINLTRERYADLCVAIQSHDLMNMRNTDRLEVVANALGWRGDALMHHLKATTGEMGKNPSLSYKTDFVGDFLNFVGIEHFEHWRMMLESGPGLFVVTGTPGNGISRAMIASALLLDSSATTDREDRVVGKRKVGGTMIYALAAGTRERLKECVELAASSTVIASDGGKSLDDTEARLTAWTNADGGSLSCLKGIMHLNIVGRYSAAPHLEVNIRDYTVR
jgi:hypothetical protein